ncbi:MAG: hypothetical protein IKI34_04060, partial [Eubacterium sp.]|nr:hypothetical protein [Eubacterium sp.]
AQAKTNESLGYLPTYNNMGKPISWATGVYTQNGNASNSEDGSVYIPDGYMYMDAYDSENDYLDNLVPISRCEKWKIDFGFRFKTEESDWENYEGSDEFSFLKMYVYKQGERNPAEKNAAFCYFAQNANGLCYSWEDDGHNAGQWSWETSITVNNTHLVKDVNYHYVAEFTGDLFKAYITDDGGNTVQTIAQSQDSTFLARLGNISWADIDAIKIGDDDNQYYYKGLEYRNITFYSGQEEEEPEPETARERLCLAIQKYEQKMDGTVYKNMTDAYKSYVEANKALDSYDFGSAQIDLDEYASDLKAKTKALSKWEYSPQFVTPYFDGDTGDNSVYAQKGVGNILYWGSPWENDGAKFSNETENVVIELWYPQNTVLLLDGEGSPAMPVLGMGKRTTGNTRYIYQLYPCVSEWDSANSPYFKLGTSAETYWYGANGKTHRTHNWIWTATLRDSDDAALIKGEAGATATDTRLYLSRDDGLFGAGAVNYWASFANTLKFIGEQEEYAKSYTVGWYAVTGNEISDYRYMHPSNQIHIINIKPLLELINSDSKKSYLSIAEKTYTQGGLENLLSAYDKATAIDVNAYDYSDNSNLSRISSDIEDAVNSLRAASATRDNQGYESLRKAISAKKSIYEAGAEGYKEESWQEFEAIYGEACRIFANLIQTGYNSAEDETAT